jgi:AhpC/TSA family/Disulphide bond corrector protein DsbC
VELQKNKAEFDKLGLGVAAISYDSVEALHNFAERRGIRFALLSDAGSKTIRALNILNNTVPEDSPFFGVPFPGTFILDEHGRIVAKYFEDDYKERFTAGDILARQFGVAPPAAKTDVEGKQLHLTASATSTSAAPGQRVRLVLDIDLKPNMHVYAPGVEGYISIDWSMKESDAAKAHDVTYPASEKLYLQAIDETVPVYRNHFGLTRDITIAQEGKVKPMLDASGNFSVEGTLRYQACDDRLCYVPQNLPLKWTFHLDDLDRQRVPAEMQHHGDH